jgi:hypothetical protein
MAADLHMHTDASDGTDSIKERVEQAKEFGLDTIAITDHDTINPGLRERSEKRDGIEVITGAEIKCELEGTAIEILGYFIDPNDPVLDELFEDLRNKRTERLRQMTKRVGKGEDLDPDSIWSDIQTYSEGTVGRPHLGKALVERGIADDMNDAFSSYIGENAPTNYYIETDKLDAEKVIETVHQNGGATSLAHPGRDLELSEAGRILDKLESAGLDAIEVPYTYQHKRQDGYGIDFGIKEAYELAKQHDFLITGGSDCHGQNSNKYNIGKIRLESEYLDAIREVAESNH